MLLNPVGCSFQNSLTDVRTGGQTEGKPIVPSGGTKNNNCKYCFTSQ